MKIGFIGLGLIGGSIAKAIRQYFPEATSPLLTKTGRHWLLQLPKESSIRQSPSLMKISVDATICFCALR